jgi:LmbE family N-acetylglucosaminyl deacetylase
MNEDKGVLVICAHSDDQILGCGGTIAKYARKGIPVYTIILSYGEGSHPHLHEEFVIKTRVKEAQDANKIIGGKNVFFLGLKEGNFEKTAEKTNAKEKIINIIKRHNINKILTHSLDDYDVPNRDHIATNTLVKEIIKEINEPELNLFTFTVWRFFKRNTQTKLMPKLVVDISNTFDTKLRALNTFKSQKLQMSLPYVQTHIKSFFNGLKYGYRFAEVFVKEN